MSSSDTTGTTLETAVVEAVMLVTGHDLTGCIEGGLRLEDDLGVDSLAAHSTFALCCELGDDRGRRRCGVIVT